MGSQAHDSRPAAASRPGNLTYNLSRDLLFGAYSAPTRMARASRASQELRKPFPAWFGEERTANQHLWCAYHNDGHGAWLDRAASFGRLSGEEACAQARRACTGCRDGPTLRRRPYSMLPTLEQCLEFAPRLSSRRMGAWRALGFDGDAAARAVGQPEDESEESGSESGDDGDDAAQQALQQAQQDATVRAWP